jgi:eukaryotic-like serine/threonine-protein kinase
MRRDQPIYFFSLRKAGGIRKLLCVCFLIIGGYGLTTRQVSAQQISLFRPFQTAWSFETESTINLTPATSKEVIYLPLAGGTLVSLTLGDGGLNWRADIGGNLSSPPQANDTGVFIASENIVSAGGPSKASGSLRALSRRSGVTLWVRPLPAPIRGGLISNEAFIFGGAADGRVYAFKSLSGEVIWVRQTRGPFASQPVLSGDLLLLGDEEGILWAINIESGRTLWRYRTRQAVRAPVAVVGETVYAGSNDGFVYALNRSDGRLRWRARTGAAVQSVTPTKRCLVAASLDNFVYCLSLQSGRKIWKRQLAGRVAAQPVATDEGVLFAPLAGEECVVLDQKDGRKVNSIFVGEENNMAASPLIVDKLLLLTTRKGLIAFSNDATAGTPK